MSRDEKNYLGFYTVLRRELQRFWSIKRQTILGPLLETFLYISVFGAALGSRIQNLEGHSYINFIIPGLLLMAMAINSYSNNSASLLQQKLMHAIDDQLSSPVSNTALMVAFTLGGFVRAAIITTITFITASLLMDLPVAHPLLLIGSLTACGLFFASLGVLIGLRAENFDNISFYQTFVLQPLIFLGGIFYSTSLLHEPFRALTHLDPIFYMINTVRYGMLGSSDVNPWISLPIISAAALAVIGLNAYLFRRGYRLRD
jgi:ABC-2 type transport system permease protein